jgi:hypothetical protein
MSLKPVFTAASDTEAEIIRNLLQDAGIESDILSDDGGGLLQSLSFAGGVTVVVDEKDLGDAMVLLDAWRKGETALAEDDEA